MMDCKTSVKSGAQKRKEKLQKQLALCGTDKKQLKLNFNVDQCKAAQKTDDKSIFANPVAVSCLKENEEEPVIPCIVDQPLILDSDDSDDRSECDACGITGEEDNTDNSILRNLKPNEQVSKMQYFVQPDISLPVHCKLEFLKNHPIQPTQREVESLPFDSEKVYFRKLKSGDKILRKWVSYCEFNSSLYCSVCMAFGPRNVDIMDNNRSRFINGLRVSKQKHNIYDSINAHESSKVHNASVSASIQAEAQKDISSLINTDMLIIHRKEVEQRRLVIRRLIDLIIFIGRQGVAYRGSVESAYSLEDRSKNHGNFLELALLLAEYDTILKEHISLAIQLSKARKAKMCYSKKESSRGRGSLVTFLSKSFINKLIKTIGLYIQRKIVDEVKKSKFFSIMIDSTQDVSIMDQMAVCLRYVCNSEVREVLIKLVIANETTGKALYEQIKTELCNLGLDFTNIVACSFDGAANMKGQYNGLQAHLKRDNPKIIYTHCLAHCLNLVIIDSVKSSLAAENLFGLLESSAVFLSDSHKRIDVWNKLTKCSYKGHDKLQRLQKIGATRWWSKDKALSAIVDKEMDQKDVKQSKFILFFKCLTEISKSNFDAKTKFTARSLLDNWSCFEHILTACIFHSIFDLTTPVSNILQSQKIDYLHAWQSIDGLTKKIDLMRNNFIFYFEKTIDYIRKLNLQLQDEEMDAVINDDFEPRRASRKKRMDDEKAFDEILAPKHDYAVKNFYTIIDSATMSLTNRFLSNSELLKDCACLDPKRFGEVRDGLPIDALTFVTDLAGVGVKDVRCELFHFANEYANYFVSLKQAYTDTQSIFMDDVLMESVSDSDTLEQALEDSDDETVSGNKFQCQKTKKCNNCLSCAFVLLEALNLNTSVYSNLYIVYKFVLTLPCTQVTCERVFSKLKIVKTRLRSALTQPFLEPLMLMNVESKYLSNLDYNILINEVADNNELKKLLF